MHDAKTVAGSATMKAAQAANDAAWEVRKAAEIAALKAQLAAKREAFFAA